MKIYGNLQVITTFTKKSSYAVPLKGEVIRGPHHSAEQQEIALVPVHYSCTSPECGVLSCCGSEFGCVEFKTQKINRSRGVDSPRAQEHYLTPSGCEDTDF